MKRLIFLFLLIPFFAQAQDSKISDFSNGGKIALGDNFVIARSGTNYRILGDSIIAIVRDTAAVLREEQEIKVGQLFISSDQTVDLAVADIYYTIDVWTTSSLAIETTLTDSTITVAADGEGYYMISQSHSFKGNGNGTICHFSIFVNDVEKTENEIERYISNAATDVGAVSNQCILWLDNSAVVKVRAKSTSTGNITIGHANFHISKL